MIQWWQILLLTLYSAYQICDELTIVSSAGSPVFAGFITGLVMGDLKTGLFIGASLQLTVLGVGTFGGASRIDATSGAVLATAFSVAQGIKPEIAISTIAVPVAALLTYADILGRMSTTAFAHRIDAAIERFDYKGIERNYLLGALPWALSRALPVFLALAFVLLHLAAAVSAILKGKKSLGTGFIIIGAIVGILALLLVMVNRTLAFYIWLFASSTICGGALLNGQNNKKFNKSHHQIRFVIDLIITFLLYVWLFLFQ